MTDWYGAGNTIHDTQYKIRREYAMDLLRNLAMSAGEEEKTDTELKQEREYSGLTEADLLPLAAIMDLRNAGAEESVLHAWTKRWFKIIEEQDSPVLDGFFLKIMDWLPIPDMEDHYDVVREQLRKMDDEFEKTLENFKEENGMDEDDATYELYEEYAGPLQYLAESKNYSHLLAELEFCAPAISRHIEDHREDLEEEDEETVGFLAFL
jgi:hypothetical protein